MPKLESWLTELERRWTLCSLCLELSTQHWGIAIKGCVSVNLCCLCSGLKLPQCASCVLGTEKRVTSCFAQILLGKISNLGMKGVQMSTISMPASHSRSWGPFCRSWQWKSSLSQSLTETNNSLGFGGGRIGQGLGWSREKNLLQTSRYQAPVPHRSPVIYLPKLGIARACKRSKRYIIKITKHQF